MLELPAALMMWIFGRGISLRGALGSKGGPRLWHVELYCLFGVPPSCQKLATMQRGCHARLLRRRAIIAGYLHPILEPMMGFY